MTAPAARPPLFKFTVNVAVPCIIKSVKVYPNKAWEGKLLPPQVSIRGILNGTETAAYLPGPAWKNLNALEAAGIIGPAPKEAREDTVAAALLIPVLDGRVSATLRKLAGEKWESMVYEPLNATTAPKPESQRVQAPIPEREGDLPGDPAYEGPASDAGAPPEPEDTDPKQTARRKNYAAYKALWRDMAAFQREVCHGPEPTEIPEGGHQILPPQERIPYDAASVNAACSTVWIGWDKRGLLP